MAAGEPAQDLRSVPIDATAGPAPGAPAPAAPARGRALRSSGDRSERLLRLRELAGDLTPLTLAQDRCLPVLPALEELVPGGLQRGTTVAVGGSGATALIHAVVAGPTQAGSWAAWVGVDGLGWAAASELGVALERVAVVQVDERRMTAALAALVDAFDLVVVGPEHRPDRTEVRRLQSRARERGAVLVVRSRPLVQGGDRRAGRAVEWGPDVQLECGDLRWSGPGQGSGHLQARRLTVSVRGRRGFDRPRRVDLWLPGPDGVTAVSGDAVSGTGRGEQDAVVVPFGRRVG